MIHDGYGISIGLGMTDLLPTEALPFLTESLLVIGGCSYCDAAIASETVYSL